MRWIRTSLMVGLWGGWAAAPAVAQPLDGEQTYQGIRYVCTGVTKEARQNPAWRSYPLKLEFAAAGGAYLADVAVRIQDQAGTSIFQAECMTPWVLIDLSPGTYRVTGTAGDNINKSLTVRIGAGRQAARVIRFPEITS